MSSGSGKTTFGASIEPLDNNVDHLTNKDRLHLSTITERDSVRSSNPQSLASSRNATPTLQSPPTFSTLEHGSDAYPTKNGLLTTHTDLEAGFGTSLSQQTTRSAATGNGYDPQKLSLETTKECSMWPTPATLKQERQQLKHLQRNKWNCWGNLTSRMTKRQKILLHILVALVVVGLAVGIGIGISKAVGGGVWSGDGESKTLPHDSD